MLIFVIKSVNIFSLNLLPNIYSTFQDSLLSIVRSNNLKTSSWSISLSFMTIYNILQCERNCLKIDFHVLCFVSVYLYIILHCPGWGLICCHYPTTDCHHLTTSCHLQLSVDCLCVLNKWWDREVYPDTPAFIWHQSDCMSPTFIHCIL